MRMLALDTSSVMTSVAVLADTEVLAQARHEDARGHLEALAPLVAQVISDRQPIDVIACGVGPGPYSGLRVGLATAAMLGLSWQVPVFGICSLDAIAAAVLAAGAGAQGFSVAADARRREEYWASYDASGVRVAGPSVQRQDVRHEGRWFGVRGTSSDGQCDATVYPDAAWIGRVALAALGGTTDAQRRVMAEDLECEPAVELSAHGTDDGYTARHSAGRMLLPVRPLYLRRADVHQGGRSA